MRYNHAYSIAFSVDSDEKDPYEVPAKVLADALLKRIHFEPELELIGAARVGLEFEIDEMVECFETIDKEED